MEPVKRLAFVVVAVVLLVGCVRAQPHEPPETANRATVEEYAVYSVVLDQFPLPASLWLDEEDDPTFDAAAVMKKYPQSPTRTLVVHDHTYLDPFVWPQRKQPLQVVRFDKTTGDDFADKNKESVPLRPWFNIKARIVLLTDEDQGHIFNDMHGWDRFYKKFPGSGGLLQLSRVGFNADYSQALVCFGYAQQRDGGSGWLIVLTKKDGKWVIEQKEVMWVA